MKMKMKMKMKKKKIISLSAAMILFGTVAFGSTSAATISPGSTGENGAVYSMSNLVEMSGVNYYASTNSLWLELYEVRSGVNRKEFSVNMARNTSYKARNITLTKTATYQVHLDPDGPYFKGCSGKGQALD